MAASPSHQGGGASAEAWETCKENVMPLAAGRRVERLNAVLKERPKGMRERRAGLEAQRAEFEARIAAAEEQEGPTEGDGDGGGDSLREWVRYINWLQESYPSDSAEATLLLERCARKFQDDARYKQDPRYLKVWISYADRLEQPGDIFKYLHKRRIGTQLALFWCAWAFVAEKAGNYSLADRLYTKGLEVQAAPLELLAARRQQFQRRMSRHWLRLQEEAEGAGSDPTAIAAAAAAAAAGAAGQATSGGRSALGQIKSRGGGGSRGVNGSSSSTSGGLRPTPSSSQRSTRPSNNNGAGAVPIFVDEGLRDATAAAARAGLRGQHPFLEQADREGQEGEGWRDIGTAAGAKKENVMGRTKWSEGPLASQSTKSHRRQQQALLAQPPQQQAPTTAAAASLPIFVDDEFRPTQEEEEGQEGMVSPVGQAQQQLRRLRTPLSARRAAARNQQQLHVHADGGSSSEDEAVKKPAALAPRARGTSPSELERLRKAPLRHFDTSCLEKKKPSTTSKPDTHKENPSHPKKPRAPLGERQLAAAAAAAATPAAPAAGAAAVGGSMGVGMEGGDDEDMTINTRFALADVAKMFAASPDAPPPPSATRARPAPVPSPSPPAPPGAPASFPIFTDPDEPAPAQPTKPGFTIFTDDNNPPATAAQPRRQKERKGQGNGGSGGAGLGFTIFSEDEKPPKEQGRRMTFSMDDDDEEEEGGGKQGGQQSKGGRLAFSIHEDGEGDGGDGEGVGALGHRLGSLELSGIPEEDTFALRSFSSIAPRASRLLSLLPETGDLSPVSHAHHASASSSSLIGGGKSKLEAPFPPTSTPALLIPARATRLGLAVVLAGEGEQEADGPHHQQEQPSSRQQRPPKPPAPRVCSSAIIQDHRPSPLPHHLPKPLPATAPGQRPKVRLVRGGPLFQVVSVLGRGSYGVVYQLLPLPSASVSASAAGDPIAVKVEVADPASPQATLPHEYRLLRLVAQRHSLQQHMKRGGKGARRQSGLGMEGEPSTRPPCLPPLALHLYRNGAALCQPLGEQGTLRDVLQWYRATRGGIIGGSASGSGGGGGMGLPECLALHFTREMVACIRALLALGVLHADVRPDNFLLWGPPGEGRLVAIDLGLAIDLRAHPPGARFTGGCAASGFRCPAMGAAQEEAEVDHQGTTGPGWREEQDLYAVGACAFALLHGEAPPKGWGEEGVGARRWRLRRYWDGETWGAVFEGLVGGGGGGLGAEQEVLARLDGIVACLDAALQGPRGVGRERLLAAMGRELESLVAGLRAGRVGP